MDLKGCAALALLVVLGSVAGCVGDDPSSTRGDGSDSDGGGVPPVDGVPAPPAFAIRVETPSPALVRGKTTRVSFTVERKNGYRGSVVVTSRHLPASITSSTVTLESGKDKGDLELVVDRSTNQGLLNGPTVEASDPDARVKMEAPLNAFVRGSPGEIDTTFATNGIVTFPGDSMGARESAVDDKGNIFVAEPGALTRFRADGAIDAGFGTNGRAELVYRTPLRLVITTAGILLASNSGSHGWVERLKLDGSADPAYPAFEVPSTIWSFGVAADGRSIVSDRNLPTTYYWRSATGAADPNVSGGTTFTGGWTPRAAIYVTDGAVMVGNDGFIQKLEAVGGAADLAFNGTGYRQIDSAVILSDVVQDSQGRFVTTGHRPSTKALFLTRTKPDGTADPSMPNVTSTFIVKPVPIMNGSMTDLAGRLALQTDGKILQAAQIDASGSTQCVMVRYNPDGQVDADFGDAGKAVFSVPGCIAKRILVQPDGRIILSGDHLVRIWN